jgi:uncharacterized protein (DUF433 family)
MDWSGCDLVELNSGIAWIKGTSLEADALMAQLKVQPFDKIAADIPAEQRESLRQVLTYGVERAGWDTKTLVDWSGCELVERVPGRCSGAPTIVGTRIFPDTIAQYYRAGAPVAEILEDFPSLSAETVSQLIRYIEMRQSSAA